MSVAGTRAQLVKTFVVWRHFRRHHEHVLVHTGEGIEEGVTRPVMKQLCLPDPDYDLSIGRPTPGRRLGRLLTYLEDIVVHEEPDVIVVYGDSATTLAGTFVGETSDALVARVEAGVRGEDGCRTAGIYREQADRMADLLFAPSERAADRLRAEGIESDIHVTGDPTVDAALGVRDHALDRSTALDRLDLDPGEYVVATVRRRLNTADGDRLSAILRGLSASPLPVVFPAHPLTVERIREHDLHDLIGDEVRLLGPLGYLDFVALLTDADRVVTDSGVVQREAPHLDTPCVTTAPGTPWVETVDCGWNAVVDADSRQLTRELSRSAGSGDERPYGDGRAGVAVREAIETAVVERR